MQTVVITGVTDGTGMATDAGFAVGPGEGEKPQAAHVYAGSCVWRILPRHRRSLPCGCYPKTQTSGPSSHGLCDQAMAS
ncbi:hypothetical protein Fuma_00072 [Fuerstiella marisgermanici]|uniref:Uncharacterized protein n=1 Tax=Fuerstiella marisgermanici TaxID=1891926 RepID=A0A1P8W8V2_9PLAN|nr:hypothetical protein Fuma_00072 [Fuerstiella marisgermanici]